MKDLSREEKLRKQLYEMQYACEKKKWSRVTKTFFVLCGVIFFVAFVCGISDTENFALWLIGIPFIAAFVIFISLMVLLYIVSGAMRDEKAIARLEGELNAIKSNKNE